MYRAQPICMGNKYIHEKELSFVRSNHANKLKLIENRKNNRSRG